jgi:Tol biopolymer transport system component
MGEVYRARDTKLDRDVALKLLPESFASDPDRLMRFQREAKTLASLNHPHIAQVFAIEEIRSREGPGFSRGIVMELVEGEDLSQRISRGPIPNDEALPIAKQIAEALEAAHEAGIVHRDLKPANIKVRPDGTVKVLDFGLAKVCAPAKAGALTDGEGPGFSPATMTSPAMTQAGLILGTAAYMAPEQAKGKPVDKRADIWAFGCVLYEMLTATRAFGGDDITETLIAIMRDAPDVSALPPGTPAAIASLIARCLEKDARLRLRDIGEARVALANVGSGASASPVALTDARRGSRVPWLVALAMTLIAFAALAALWYRPSNPATAAPLPMRFAFVPPGNLVADDPGFDDIVVSPDGTKLVFTAREGNGPRQLWVRALDTLEARLLPETEDAVEPFWSPDSQSVGFGADGKLKRIDLAGRRAQVLADAARLNNGSSWSRDGVIVFTPDFGAGLHYVPAAGGAPARLKSGGAGPCFLPDGRHFIYTRGRQAWLASLDSDDEVELPGVTNRVFYAAHPASAPPLADGGTGWLLFVKDGDLAAQAFDAGRRALVGDVRRVRTDAAISQSLSEARRFVSVSDTGTLVLMAPQARDYQLLWVDRAGQKLGAIGEVLKSSTPSIPSISPDGTKVLVQRRDPRTPGQEIWVYDIARGTFDRVTTGPANSQAPVWSPDGQQVFFQTARKTVSGTYRAPATGGDPQLLLAGTGGTGVFPTTVSPDGRWLIYFQRGETTRVDLWALALPGTAAGATSPPEPFAVVNSSFEETAADLSPDGRWLAYASDVSGAHEVYVRRFNGAERKVGEPVRVSTGSGIHPRWRKDGGELFYQRAPQGSSRAEMMAVTVKAGGETIEFATPTPLFTTRLVPSEVYRDYDVTRDGQRFVIGTLLDGPAVARPGAIVVLNWQAELSDSPRRPE